MSKADSATIPPQRAPLQGAGTRILGQIHRNKADGPEENPLCIHCKTDFHGDRRPCSGCMADFSREIVLAAGAKPISGVAIGRGPERDAADAVNICNCSETRQPHDRENGEIVAT